MAKLPINYTDDILDISVNTKRKFNMIQNDDGTVSFEDVTVYEKVGSDYGASDINKTNHAVNKLDEKMQFITGGFVLEDLIVTLDTKSFTYSDPRITSSSLAMIYWDEKDANDIYNAKVTAETINGGIKFKSENTSNTAFKCSVYVVAEESED